MKAIITGRPGIGKSTVLKEVIKILQGNGWKVGGIICPEVRIDGRRVSFEIIDILSGDRGVLASVKGSGGPMVGRYYVNMSDLDRISLSAISRSLEEADITVIDEIGPMEMKSHLFRDMVTKALSGDKKMIAVVHWGLTRDIASKFRNLKLFEVTELNRNLVAHEITKYLLGGSFEPH